MTALLTAPGINIQHFRHDPATPNKECDERQAYFDPTYGRSLRSLNSHAMPLRITLTDTSFVLQLGFFYPPDSKAYCDRIKIAGDSHQIFEYSFERIEKIGTTYLNVGSIPSQVYRVEYVNANSELKRFWPNKITGINTTGSFFDGRTGQILQSGGKAYSGNPYYLLQRYPLYSYHTDIEATEVARTQANPFTTWYLYKIRIKKFSAFYQGCDHIRSIHFVREKANIDVLALDAALVKELNSWAGPMIPITHAVGSFSSKLTKYPQTQRWLRTALRCGKISRTALYLLRKTIQNNLGRDNND